MNNKQVLNEEILNTLNSLIERLNIIDTKLDVIEKDMEYLKKGNNNMLNHISFVENVYDTIKSPFYFILNKIKPIEIPPRTSSLLPSFESGSSVTGFQQIK
jgi:glycerol-3-phosphate responsive antiterminator